MITTSKPHRLHAALAVLGYVLAISVWAVFNRLVDRIEAVESSASYSEDAVSGISERIEDIESRIDQREW